MARVTRLSRRIDMGIWGYCLGSSRRAPWGSRYFRDLRSDYRTSYIFLGGSSILYGSAW